MSGTVGFRHTGYPQTHGVSQQPQPSPFSTVCWCSRLSRGTLTCSEGSDPRPRGFGQEVQSVEVWSVRLFLKRQAWIWAQESLRSGRAGPRHRASQGKRGNPHLMHGPCCQFRTAALSLGHIVQWQRHGLQAAVLFQGLCHVQQAQSRCVVPVPDHRPGPGWALVGGGALQGAPNPSGLFISTPELHLLCFIQPYPSKPLYTRPLPPLVPPL